MPNRDLNLEREWKIKFEEFKKSGLSIRAWCEKNNIIYTTFHYWIRRFKKLEQEIPEAKTQFAKKSKRKRTEKLKLNTDF